MRPSTVRRQPGEPVHGMEPARVGYHKIVADILRRAPADDAARIAWQLVSGSKVSRRTSVIELAGGVLRVRVPDSTWRTQLAEFLPEYAAALHALLKTKLERIEFVPDDKKPAHRA